ncbi:hypothetical protein BG015_006222 [Linnemannia schmuckeri]|uniref:SH3 domain-containing protein n=1 Tax=Linnemannia schmuckeri TaxID=64567 RepID=A0A9P5S0D6_9FUNG|nr:hypothetical protein BG015_006222 [Linnemannia schmuckeri]
MTRSLHQPYTRHRSNWLAKALLSATLLATGAQAACVPLANSTACPLFSSYSIDNVTVIANAKSYGIVLQPFATHAEFDIAINKAAAFQPASACQTYNSSVRVPYQNTVLCTIAVHEPSDCNSDVKDPVNIDLCISSCKTFETGFASLAKQLCPNNAAWETSNLNALKTICSGSDKGNWQGLQSTATDCINSEVNEAAFCGLANLQEKCKYCNTNSTATCCNDAGTTCPKSTTSASTGTSTSFSIPPTNQATPTSPTSTGMSSSTLGAIIGGSVGALVLAGLLIFLCIRRSRKSSGGKKGNNLSRQMSNSSGRYNISAPKVQEQGFAAAMPSSQPIPMNNLVSSGASDRSSLGAAVAAAGAGAATGGALAVAGAGGREATGKQSYCQALYPYQASMADELDLTPGDIVNVQRVFDDGWAVGVNMNTSSEGAFPVVCVMFVDESALEDDFEDVNMHSMTPMTLREEDEGRKSPSGRNSPRSSLPSRSSSPVHLPRRNSSIRDSTVIVPGTNPMTSSPLANGNAPGGRMTPPVRDTMMSDASSINRWWDGENAR